MQMGEMVRNLPSNAVQNFRWDAYASALITALGFDPRNWVRSPEEVAMEQGAVAAQETNAALAQTMAQPAAQAMAQAAQPAIEEAINQAPEENAEAAIAVAQQMMGQ